MEKHRTVCPHDCPDACSLVACMEDGQVVRVEGDPTHPFTRGSLCGKVRRYADRIYSADRVLHPLRRTGPKGTGQFARVSWDEALDEITGQFREIIERYGGEALLPYSYCGTMGLVQNHAGHRFFHRLGASCLGRTICSSCVEAAYHFTYGTRKGNDLESVVESDLVILWGMNAVATNLHGFKFIQEAQRRGAKLWVVDVYRTRTVEQADEFVRLRPGTDAALALGMMHVLIRENLLDHDYIETFTHGFDRLKPHVLEHYLPERCAEITGAPGEQIERLARAYGAARAPFLRPGYGFSRQPNGGQSVRSVACLPGLVGAFRKRGGGLMHSTTPHFEFDLDRLERPDLQPHGTREINMCLLGEALLEAQPPLRAMYVYNSNPAAVAPDSERVRQGLLRDDLFLVVHEQMHTDTVDYADVVLPATTSFEHTDLYYSYGHLYLQMARPAITPLGEARSNWEVFRLLAERMGLEDECFQASEEDLIRELLEEEGRGEKGKEGAIRQLGNWATGQLGNQPQPPEPNSLISQFPSVTLGTLGTLGTSYEVLSDGAAHRLNQPVFFDPFADGFPTPSGRLEFYSEALERLGQPPLPTYVPSPQGHEFADDIYHLQLVTPPSLHFLNSSFGSSASSRRLEGRPTLQIHPTDAAARGIADGDLVRVFSRAGECFLYAEVTDAVAPGVVVAESIWWAKHSPGGKGINSVTTQLLTDLGGGGTFHGNLVGVEKVTSDE